MGYGASKTSHQHIRQEDKATFIYAGRQLGISENIFLKTSIDSNRIHEKTMNTSFKYTKVLLFAVLNKFVLNVLRKTKSPEKKSMKINGFEWKGF